MQKQITTHKGDTILLIEVPFKPFNVGISLLNYLIADTNDSANWQEFKYKLDCECEIIGTTSTLNEKDVEPFVEGHCRIKGEIIEGIKNEWFNYNNQYSSISKEAFCKTAVESWNSFLQHNGIDLSKEWVVLKIKND